MRVKRICSLQLDTKKELLICRSFQFRINFLPNKIQIQNIYFLISLHIIYKKDNALHWHKQKHLEVIELKLHYIISQVCLEQY